MVNHHSWIRHFKIFFKNFHEARISRCYGSKWLCYVIKCLSYSIKICKNIWKSQRIHQRKSMKICERRSTVRLLVECPPWWSVCHLILDSSPTQVYGWNGLAAILVSKKSAGVAPEGNLRICCVQVTKYTSEWIHLGFETQGRRHQKSKNRSINGPTKGLMSFKNF